MFTKRSVRWVKPENKTLILTYDDGPGQASEVSEGAGPRTLELAKYLAEKNIPATFFVIGRRAELHVTILQTLTDLGHLVANHTYSHPGTPPPRWTDPVVDHVAEIRRTHAIIKPYVHGKFFFRSPGGDGWPESKPQLVDELNGDPCLHDYIGPVGWNIDSEDWKKWRDNAGAEAAADHINKQIQAGGGGIVLMHDCSTEYEAEIRRNNRALEVARILVPRLRNAGYQFKRLDELPLEEF